MKRDLISIDDLSNAEIGALLAEARACESKSGSQALDGAILATVFLEPSTRTRLSFEAAMHRLGGSVITSADPQTSSNVKGESLADTIRMVDGYADVIALRHPAAGAARAAAKVAAAPILNAGDGGHEHPSQTLVDLYTLEREVGRLSGLRVMVYGDLRYGRTAHSLVRALWRFGATTVAVGEPGLELPDYVTERLQETGATLVHVGVGDLGIRPGAGPEVRATIIAPADAGRSFDASGGFDAIYVTRVQKERLPSARSGLALPPIDPEFLALAPFARAIVMHPLPRTGEIDPRIDCDRRAAYFRQAAFGVPVRMALLQFVSGRLDLGGPREEARKIITESGGACSEGACISVREPQSAVAESVRGADGRRRCAYCESPWPA